MGRNNLIQARDYHSSKKNVDLAARTDLSELGNEILQMEFPATEVNFEYNEETREHRERLSRGAKSLNVTGPAKRVKIKPSERYLQDQSAKAEEL
jgi:hypothetical protein